MIKYIKGNLLASSAEALVNTVNTVGVMGKGIALQFKNRFPHNYKVYRDACKKGTFKTGEVLVVSEGDLLNQKIIINFPTKAHWKAPSKYEYVTSGLDALKKAIEKHGIRSIAIPPLGCGNGGLEWAKVKKLMEDALGELDCIIEIFTPNDEIKAILQKEETPKQVKLTPARAMLLYLMFQYEAMGEQSSLFVANKLAYFLQRSGENLRLKFQPHHYGPYSVQLNHVLLHLNGVYLKGLEQNVAKSFEPLILNYNKLQEIEAYIEKQLTYEQRQRLENVLKLLRGFESTFSLELLATVDFLSSKDSNESVEDIVKDISNWGERKAKLFKGKYVNIAYDQLQKYSTALAFS